MRATDSPGVGTTRSPAANSAASMSLSEVETQSVSGEAVWFLNPKTATVGRNCFVPKDIPLNAQNPNPTAAASKTAATAVTIRHRTARNDLGVLAIGSLALSVPAELATP